MSRRLSASACLLGLALIAPLPAQEREGIRNWSAPPFWIPPKAAKPDDSASSAEAMAVEGVVTPMPYIATVPCRVVDTRNAPGPYGGPAIAGGAAARTFNIPGGPCGIPAGADAYSINVAAILPSADGFLTVYPTGFPQPLASDLNFLGGEVIANALIVPAGTGGSINVFANVTTHLIIDINGYYLAGALDPTYVSEGEGNSVTSTMIVDGSIVNADISPSAAIADTKLATIATAGKVADTALSANVTKLGSTIEASEITNITRRVAIPLTSFIDCQTGSGAYLDFTSGTDPIADFLTQDQDGFFTGLRFDATVGSPDEDSEICAQFGIPSDWVSGGAYRVSVSKANTAANSEVLNCNDSSIGGPGAVTLLANNIYICTPLSSYFAGTPASVAFWISSPGTMDDAVFVTGVVFEYTASH